MDKTVTQIMEQVKSEICDDYCKWPEEYLQIHNDPDEAQAYMLAEKCTTCPLQKL